MTAILQEIISLLVSGITQVATGIGAGLNTLVRNIFIAEGATASDPDTLSVFGGMIVVFAGIGLAIGLCKFVVNWLTSFGN